MKQQEKQLLSLSETDWNSFVKPAACENYYNFSVGGKSLYFKMDAMGFITF